MELTIYHHTSCSKSRGTLELLREAGVEPRVVDYLRNPPSVDELRELLARLGVGARDLVRTNEAEYAELGLDGADDEALLEAMAAHPVLIQRPVVVRGDRAVIGRPPERVRELLEGTADGP